MAGSIGLDAYDDATGEIPACDVDDCSGGAGEHCFNGRCAGHCAEMCPGGSCLPDTDLYEPTTGDPVG